MPPPPAVAVRALTHAPLAFIGRHATKFMAAGVLVGLVVPPLAALAKPLLAPTLVIPLALALVRLDWSAMAAWRRRPALVVALVVFILGVSPLLVWAITTPRALRSDFPTRSARGA